jgi:NADPH-dependent glutamate synthase beta subunit-like oxidoreductase
MSEYSKLKSLFSSKTFYTHKGLHTLHKTFLNQLSEEKSLNYEQKAPFFDHFIADLFDITIPLKILKDKYTALYAIPKMRRDFIQRYVLRLDIQDPKESYDLVHKNLAHLWENTDTSPLLSFAQHICQKINKNGLNPEVFYWETQYCLHMLKTRPWRHFNKKPGEAFHVTDSLWACPANKQVNRQGFFLTDHGASDAYLIEESSYCLKCHKRDKDSCRSGLQKHEKDELFGCPLDQKISEMIDLIELGYPLSALAIVMVDNPLLAATGHRICNDCQKACIFQNQTPVDVPQIETRLLKDILNLPYGFEIYSLLTRWNPFHPTTPLPKTLSNKAVFIAGAGPAGFTLAYHLMRLGHKVFVAEGLQINPLPPTLVPSSPEKIPLIHNISDFFTELPHRKHKGFGGVMEYGITARWDKNFLLLIRLILERNPQYYHSDGIRLGRNLKLKQLIDYGFHHISLCTGAGKPHILPAFNLPSGVRLGVDFLMNLHLTKEKMNLKKLIKLPAYVYGGGLTAIDTATEVLAAYTEQLQMIHSLHQKKDPSLALLEEMEIETFLSHHKQLTSTPSVTKKKNLLQSWGGVTILYRKSLTEAPSYKLNKHEVENALYEGVQIIENHVIKSWQTTHNYLSHIIIENTLTKREKLLPAGSLFLALGTKPNTTVLEEDESFQAIRQQLVFYDRFQKQKNPSKNPKEPQPFFIYFSPNHVGVSALGDLHPTFAGSVVKAMASAKYAAQEINQHLNKIQPIKKIDLPTFTQQFETKLTHLKPLSKNLLEISVHAPHHLSHYQLGHFYKIQCYETSSLHFLNGRAVTPIKIDRKKQTFKALIDSKETHAFSSPQTTNEKIYLMGPIGTPLDRLLSEKILIKTDPLNFYLLSIAQKFKERKQLLSIAYTRVPSRFEQNLHTTYFGHMPAYSPEEVIPDLMITDHATDYDEHTLERHKVKTLQLEAKSLQCMMGGICAHCIKPNPNRPGGWLFSCQNQFTSYF